MLPHPRTRPGSRVTLLGRVSFLAAALFAATATIGGAKAETSHSFLFDPYPASLSGSYLAARHADQQRDVENAVEFYRETLAGDPENANLMERTFVLLLANGDFDEAMELANRLVTADKTNRLAHLVLGVKAHKQRSYDKAEAHFKAASEQGPLARLTATLLTAWSLQGAGKTDAALAWLEEFGKKRNHQVFSAYHAGLIAGLAGRREAAVKHLAKAYELDSNAVRIVDAYIRSLARVGKIQDAKDVVKAFEKVAPRHPLIGETLAAIDSGKQPAPLIKDVQSGAAEVFYWLGSAIGRDSVVEQAVVFLQQARYLDPQAELATVALAALFERHKRYQRAIETYKLIDEKSPLKRGTEIQIGLNYSILNDLDSARKHLGALVEKKSRRPRSGSGAWQCPAPPPPLPRRRQGLYRRY